MYEGTAESYYVPAFIAYWDDFARSEFVIPASDLEDMTGGTITAIKFYTKSNNVPYTSVSEADFYMKEVGYTSISAYETKTNSTIVYHGTISIVSANDGGEVTITFSTPYTYGGGNLLIGSENTTDSGYKFIYFYGQTVTGASIAGSNSSSAASAPATQQNFIPKTTFTYEPATAYPKPTNVAVDNITARSAKVTWDGDANALSYNVRYREVGGMVNTFFDDFESGLNDWTIYTDGESPNTNGWYQYNPSGLEFEAVSGNYVASAWSWASTAYDADNWLITPQVTFDKKLKFWVRTNSGYPDEYAVLLSTTGNAESDFTVTLQAMATAPAIADWTQITIDLSAYENQTGYIAFHHVSNDCNYLLIDDVSIGHETTTGEWETIPNATSPQDITGLNPSTEYEVQVQAVYADDSSDWTNSVHFTTLSAGAMPTDLAVSDVTAYTAKATWNGSQDSYNLRYRKITFFESFETFPGNWTIIDSDGDGYTWSQTDLTTQFSSSYTAVEGNNVVMSRSWINSTVGAVNPDQWLISPQVELGGMLKYFVMDELNYPETYRIYVSTTGTDISDFEPLTDDLLTPNTNKWTERTVDLSAYNGVQGYIAFRHYNCYDQSFMFIDAVSIGDNWTTVNNVTSPKTITGLAAESDYEIEVQGIYDNNTTDWTLPVYFTTLEAQAEEATLAEICQNGVITEGQNEYVIADKLIAVYADADNGLLWCKDQGNQSIIATEIAAGQIDFMNDETLTGTTGQNGRAWDQSNWVVLKFPKSDQENGVAALLNDAVEDNKVIAAKTVTGRYIDDANYTIEVQPVNGAYTLTFDGSASYVKNVYCVANFLESNTNYGSNTGAVGAHGDHYFFMNPKIQEICHITYAMWDGEMFTTPSNTEIPGAFTVGWGFNTTGGAAPTLVSGETYQFDAIVAHPATRGGMLRGEGTPSDNYVVYPTNLTGSGNIITAINGIYMDGSREVVGIEYVNSLGQVGKRPFSGVNIVVTRYSDGTTTTAKKVFK